MRVLQLLGDVLGNELSVSVRVADLHDVYVYGLADQGGYICLDGVHAYAAFADKHAGAGSVNAYSDLVCRALDVDLGNASGIMNLLEVVPDLLILDEVIGEILLGRIPAGIPVLDYANAETVRINFLSHDLPSYFIWSRTMVMWLVRLRMRVALPCALGLKRFRVGP